MKVADCLAINDCHRWNIALYGLSANSWGACFIVIGDSLVRSCGSPKDPPLTLGALLPIRQQTGRRKSELEKKNGPYSGLVRE